VRVTKLPGRGVSFSAARTGLWKEVAVMGDVAFLGATVAFFAVATLLVWFLAWV
jgi:hypothetical protein